MKTKEEITDLIFESMREEVAQFVEEQCKITSSTEYEDRILELGRKFAAGLVKHSAGELPKSRNSKKSPDTSGDTRVK